MFTYTIFMGVNCGSLGFILGLEKSFLVRCQDKTIKSIFWNVILKILQCKDDNADSQQCLWVFCSTNYFP